MKHLARFRALRALAVIASLLAAAPALAGGDAAQAKVNAYVDLVNRWTPIVRDGQRIYLAWADAKAGPTCQERALRAPNGLPDFAERELAKTSKAQHAKPALAVDAAVGKMVAALTALAAPTREAATYYGRRAFKDDACKRGKELHGAMMAQWDAYLEAEREVRAFLVEHNDKEALAALDKAKKQHGAKLRYHFEKLLIDGKALVREVDAQLGTDAPDASAIDAKLGALGATLDAVAPMADKDKIDKALFNDLYQGGYTSFLRMASALRVAGDQLLEALRAPASGTTERAVRAAAERVDGKRKNLFDVYNQMVTTANKTRFSPRVK